MDFVLGPLSLSQLTAFKGRNKKLHVPCPDETVLVNLSSGAGLGGGRASLDPGVVSDWKAEMEIQALLTSNAGPPFLSRRILSETKHFREGGSSGLQRDLHVHMYAESWV